MDGIGHDGEFRLAGAFVRYLVLFRLFRGRSTGVLFLFCKLLRVFTKLLITSMWFGMLVDCYLGIE